VLSTICNSVFAPRNGEGTRNAKMSVGFANKKSTWGGDKTPRALLLERKSKDNIKESTKERIRTEVVRMT